MSPLCNSFSAWAALRFSRSGASALAADAVLSSPSTARAVAAIRRVVEACKRVLLWTSEATARRPSDPLRPGAILRPAPQDRAYVPALRGRNGPEVETAEDRGSAPGSCTGRAVLIRRVRAGARGPTRPRRAR